ncbi:MAG: hypothetical protein BZ138_04780 [Methanosphaera sp. rholeuAM270]|nr:MAG: hypothetical protein BZ138_04780 [Methanosphaera sp. rholeuAM270]
MNVFFKTGKIIFQFIASILIILALILEHLAKTKTLKEQKNKEIGNKKYKKIVKRKPTITPIS